MTGSEGAAAHRVFISYSHDSDDHRRRVLELSNRLRRDGVDCWIDRYEQAPPEGWPNWMRRQIRDARFVLVVCTATYQRRVEGLEAPGRGYGVVWEGGLVTTTLYDAQGRNEKFIPVLFSSEDEKHIPDFLRGTTRYLLDSDEEYDALYARLTGQPLVEVPPLGPVRPVGVRVQAPAPLVEAPSTPAPPAKAPLAPEPSAGSPPLSTLVLVRSEFGTIFLQAERIEEREDGVELLLCPEGSWQVRYVERLYNAWDPTRKIAVAFKTTAHVGIVKSVAPLPVEDEKWKLVLEIVQPHYEYSTATRSADEFAVLRARRILLDEHAYGYADESAIRSVIGLGWTLDLKESPLPDLYTHLWEDPQHFLRSARLLAILYLRVAGTVEKVVQLNLFLRSDEASAEETLQVHFVGRRPANAATAPYEIRVNGRCPLPRMRRT